MEEQSLQVCLVAWLLGPLSVGLQHNRVIMRHRRRLTSTNQLLFTQHRLATGRGANRCGTTIEGSG